MDSKIYMERVIIYMLMCILGEFIGKFILFVCSFIEFFYFILIGKCGVL